MNGILAAILSFFIPGLGQALSGELQKGIVLFILAVIMLLIANFVFRHWIVTIIDLSNICSPLCRSQLTC